MKFLKGLAVSFLSLILFFSLSLFGLIYMLDKTILNADFIAMEIDKLNVAQLSREIINMQMPKGQEMPVDSKLITEAIYQVLTRFEPQLKAEAKQAVRSGYDYLLGRTNQLNIVIDLEPIKANLKENLRQSALDALKNSPPPELQAIPPELYQQYFDQYFGQFFEQFYQEIDKNIPPTIALDESKIPPEALPQIRQIRMYLGYYPLVFKGLIGLMAILVILIILIERSLKGITRSLGLGLLFYGGFGYLLDFAALKFAPSIPMPPGTPPYLESWIMGLANDFTAPLKTLAIGMAIIGAVLFILSFFLPKPKET